MKTWRLFNMQTISLYLYRMFWTLKILLKFVKNWKGQKQRKSFKIVFVELYRIFLLSLNCKNFPLIIFLLIGFLTSKRKSLFQNGFSLVGAAGAWQRDTSWHLVTDINFIIAASVAITSSSTSNHPRKKYWNSDYIYNIYNIHLRSLHNIRLCLSLDISQYLFDLNLPVLLHV